ncbi:basic leucine zipper 43-like [Arachis stenosperma]|uniref:basic leucine zipper 43-like n=1 Tax=Arachis stenosperma TaxID=217475 RepID=UPI0025ABDDE6|nr:basic leucine zipper 43-like [Arachis stenosperma]
MQEEPREVVTSFNYLLPNNNINNTNPSPYPLNYTAIQNNNNYTPTTRFCNQIYANFPNYPHHHQQMFSSDFSPQSSYSYISMSSNSTSDEAEEQQLSLINERKHRRMISNRESARRSRMRKQRHLDELWSQVVWLRNENHQLMEKLNHVSECHEQVLQENAQLKEEASELRQMLSDMKIHSPNHLPPPPLLEEDVPNSCASNQSLSSSMDLVA